MYTINDALKQFYTPERCAKWRVNSENFFEPDIKVMELQVVCKYCDIENPQSRKRCECCGAPVERS